MSISPKLKITLFSLSLLLSSAQEACCIKIELEDTPLGTYTSRTLTQKAYLPESYSLRKMPPVQDQGPIGTCASFAITTAGGYLHGKPFSTAEFTVLAETDLPAAEGGDCKPGVNSLGGPLKVGQRLGFVSEENLSYERFLRYVKKGNKNFAGSPDICMKFPNPVLSYNETMKAIGCPLRRSGTFQDVGYTIGDIYPLHHVSSNAITTALRYGGDLFSPEKGSIGAPTQAKIYDVKYALSQKLPVLAALRVYDTWEDSQGEIEMPARDNKYRGMHAVVLMGYDDENKMFRLQNSWSDQWGDFGYADIPYEYVRTYSTELIAISKSHLRTRQAG